MQANGICLAFMHIHIWQKNRTYTRACASNRDRLDFMRRVSLLFGQYGFISEIKGQVFIVYCYIHFLKAFPFSIFFDKKRCLTYSKVCVLIMLGNRLHKIRRFPQMVCLQLILKGFICCFREQGLLFQDGKDT